MPKKDFSNLVKNQIETALQDPQEEPEKLEEGKELGKLEVVEDLEKLDKEEDQEEPKTQGAYVSRETQPEHIAQENLRKERKRYTPEEAQAILESGRNAQGLGGVKMPRINIAFSPVNYDFIRTLARGRGESYTEFVNLIIDEYRKEHMEQYEIALKLRASF